MRVDQKYIFENDLIKLESNLHGFSDEIYQDFLKRSQRLNLKQKIYDLFDGQKVNFTENKAASHTKLRKLKDIDYIKFNKSTISIFIIGIGGSYTGPKLLAEALFSNHSNHLEEYNIHFISGTDDDELDEKFGSSLKSSELDNDLSNVHFYILSKSFTTKETIINFKKILDYAHDKRGINRKEMLKKFTAVTSNKIEAKKYGIEDIIEIKDCIGGRYSIWSKMSSPLITNELRRNIFIDFLKSGNEADQDLFNDDEYFYMITRLAFSDIWMNNIKNKDARVILSYPWKLRSLPEYFQQLEMESLGKPKNHDSKYQKTSQIIFGGSGQNAQHSYFQLLHQGTNNICVDIIKSNNKNFSNHQADVQAKILANGADDLKENELINGNIPVNLFSLSDDYSKTLGYLIATWEHRVFITSIMLQINAFDQFGVNAGKIYTNGYHSDKD